MGVAAVPPWAVVPVLLTAGGIVYPTAYLVGWVVTTDGTAEVALGIMLTGRLPELLVRHARCGGPGAGRSAAGVA